MYELALGGIFKNEADNIVEFIEHYLFHGVEHFYFINDQSTDNYAEVLEPYIQQGIVTLFHGNEPKVVGRQVDSYNRYFLPIKDECKWLLIADFDEFLYSPFEIDIRKVLHHFENFAQIRAEWLMFGSDGYDEQPNLLVPAFLKRCDHGLSYKSFVQTKFLKRIGVHTHEISEGNILQMTIDKEGNAPFIINHYRQQSFQRWKKRVSTRGDVDLHRPQYANEFPDCVFFEHNYNDVLDTRLLEQNKPIIEKILHLKNKYKYF